MEMTNLKLLHRSMMESELDHQQFKAKVGAAEFDCLFSALEPRPVLVLASRASNPKLFRFAVGRGYKIDAYLGTMYDELRDLYFGRGKSGRKLQSRDFFEELHSRIPTVAADTMVPTPEQLDRMTGSNAA